MDKIYIAGPMANLPNCNYEAFDDAEWKLRAAGAFVINPANVGRAKFGGRIDFTAYEIQLLMREELELLKGCNKIFLLRGWEKSKGARKELEAALKNNLTVELQN